LHRNGAWREWEEWSARPGSSQFPFPPGFKQVNKINTDFEHWGKYTTWYSSLGFHGTSERWDNGNMKALNMIAGFKFKVGPEASKIWKGVDKDGDGITETTLPRIEIRL